MWIIFLAVFFGFLPSSRSQNLAVKSRSCSYVGVFHVEGTQRYNLTFEEAKSLCKHLSASLAQFEEVQKAYDAGLQTCRYGWIGDRRSAILRHRPHKTCLNNLVGIRFLQRNHSDAFCYDAKDLSVKNCTALSGIYLSATEKSDGDPGMVPADTFENSTSDIPPPKDTTALQLSTEVYWTNDGSTSVSESSRKDNETDPFYSDNSDHENSTSDIPRLKDTTALQSSTEVYWTNDGSTSVSESSRKDNETDPFYSDNSDHENSTSDIPRLKDTTALQSSTEVYWTNDGSTSENTLQSSTKHTEIHQSYSENLDWLVILLVILAVLLILLLCVVAATRKRCCGRKQTLVISKVSRAEGNGTSASFTQQPETIKLMNTEKIPASNSEVVDIGLNE